MATKDTIVGLDIGRYSAKAAWVESRRDDAPAVTRVELLELPHETSDSRSVVGPWIEKMELAKFPCIIGLPGQQCMFQPLLLPPADPRTLEQAAAMEIVKFNEMASETMIYGFAPFSVEAHERRLLLAMARPTVLDESLGFSKEMGLDIIDIVPSPVALFNALELNTADHASPHIYLNIGHSATEMAIGTGKGLMFARAFASGGQMFTDALARNRNLTSAQAESLKVTEGSIREGDGPAAAALAPVADLWISELQSCLSVYQNLFPGRKTQPVRAVLAGGASELRGLPEFIAGKLNIETVCADALPGNAVEEKPAQFALAAGLAISELEEAPTRISLLPAQVRDELTFRRQKPFWIAAATAAALTLAVSLVGGYRDFRRNEKHLSAQRTSLKRRQKLVAQIETVKAGNEQIRSMAKPIKNLLRTAPLMRDLIMLTADSTAAGDWITMICDADSYFSHEPLAPPPPDRSTRGRRLAGRTAEKNSVTNRLQRVMIEGYTRTFDLTAVKELIARLTAADFIESADLLSDDKVVSDDSSEETPKIHGAQRFVIDVKVSAL